MRLRYASMYDCRHNRARIFHVNQRALYAAIGEADSRLRKPVTLNHAIQRLMVLDAIVEDPDRCGSGPPRRRRAPADADPDREADLPHVTVGEGRIAPSGTPDRLPIDIVPAAAVVVYVVTDPGWMNSASSSYATLRCSGRCPRGRSGSSSHHSSRTSLSGRSRSSGTSC